MIHRSFLDEATRQFSFGEVLTLTLVATTPIQLELATKADELLSIPESYEWGPHLLSVEGVINALSIFAEKFLNTYGFLLSSEEAKGAIRILEEFHNMILMAHARAIAPAEAP